MAFRPPEQVQTTTGQYLSSHPLPYIVKAATDDDSAWNLVETRPHTTLTPAPGGEGFLPEETTVVYADGSVRMFDPNETLLVGPPTERADTQRQELRSTGDALGWELQSPAAHHEVFTRNGAQIDVYYDNDDAIKAKRSRDGESVGFSIPDQGARSAAVQWFRSDLGAW